MTSHPAKAFDAKLKSRKTTQLSSLMDHRLAAYALVATAAAAGVPAFAQTGPDAPAYSPATATGMGLPAFAENRPNAIVYTSANISFTGSVSRGKNIGIDFVGSGTVGISIRAYGHGNRTVNEGSWTFKSGQARWFGSAMPRALASGDRIGPHANFSGSNLMLRSEWTDHPSSKHICFGPFQNAQSMYMGVRFSSFGETHFGWVRVSAHCGGGKSRTYVAGTITGYAYNTIPNEPIKAGQVYAKPPEEEGEATKPSAPGPGTLGALSLGSVLRKQ
jgi:hypothetical protein